MNEKKAILNNIIVEKTFLLLRRRSTFEETADATERKGVSKLGFEYSVTPKSFIEVHLLTTVLVMKEKLGAI